VKHAIFKTNSGILPIKNKRKTIRNTTKEKPENTTIITKQPTNYDEDYSAAMRYDARRDRFGSASTNTKKAKPNTWQCHYTCISPIGCL